MYINYERLVHYIHHHYVGVILISVFLSVVGGYFTAQLKVKSDLANLLPEDHLSVRELNRIRARVGGIGPLMVIITGDDVGKSVDFMLALADSLEHNRHIGSVVRGKDREFWSRNRFLYMEREDLETVHSRIADYIEEQKLRQSPLYFALDEKENELDFSDLEEKYSDQSASELEKAYYLTKEKNGVVLSLYPVGVITDLQFNQRLFQSLERTIRAIDPKSFHPSIEYTYKGSLKNSSYEYQLVIEDLRDTALYAFLGVLVLISLYFRQVLASLFIVLPLLMGVSWTFGLTYLVIDHLNLITVGLFAILFGLGIDFGIHIFARYREARRRGIDVEEALSETICHTGRALTTTAATTSVAFFSLMATDFKGFSEFGFIVGIGTLFSLAAMLATCPAFIVLAERLNLIRLKKDSLRVFRRGRYPLPLLTIVLALAATAFSFFHLNDLEFEYDFTKLKPSISYKNKVSLPDALKETRSPAIVLTENFAEAAEVVETVKRIKAANGDSSTIRSIKSVYSFLPQDQPEKLDLIQRIEQLVDDSEDLIDEDQRAEVDSLRQFLDVRELTLHDLPQDVTKKFTGKNGEILNFVMINASVPLRDGKNAINFAREIREIRTPSGKAYHASSAHIIFADMLQIMIDDSKIAVVLTLLVVIAVLLVDLRNVAATLLVLTPLLNALVWVTGFMYLFDIRLNLYNMVAFPTMIGMGIDNGVHIYHRYCEEGKHSLRFVLRTTGIALLATSLTTMVGFSGLIPANHPALVSIGTLSLIGLGCCFVTAVTLLPAILQIRENNSGRQG